MHLTRNLNEKVDAVWIDRHEFEQVEKFKYLELIITSEELVIQNK